MGGNVHRSFVDRFFRENPEFPTDGQLSVGLYALADRMDGAAMQNGPFYPSREEPVELGRTADVLG